MDSTMIERAYDISPLNGAVYGFLVVILVTAVVYLWRYLTDFLNRSKETTEKIIERNTLAFEKYNQRLEDEKKKESDIEAKMIVLIEQTSHLISLFAKNEERLLEKIVKSNEDMINKITKKREGTS